MLLANIKLKPRVSPDPLIFPLKNLKAIYLLKPKILAMIAAEKRHEDDLYAALWKQDEQVKAAREVAETAEQLKRNQGRKSTVETN